MDGIHTSLACPACGRPMRLVKSAPRGGLPELQTFECRACGISFTQAAERAEGRFEPAH
jgi:transposase-like protein